MWCWKGVAGLPTSKQLARKQGVPGRWTVTFNVYPSDPLPLLLLGRWFPLPGSKAQGRDTFFPCLRKKLAAEDLRVHLEWTDKRALLLFPYEGRRANLERLSVCPQGSSLDVGLSHGGEQGGPVMPSYPSTARP